MFALKYERKRRRVAQVTVKDIPHEIFFDILKRLPVKSLLKFRCVNKSWRSLIGSPRFISAHLETNSMKSGCDYLLMRTGNVDCLSFFCLETYAKCFDIDLPRHDKRLSSYCYFVFGSCNGLLCLSHGIGRSMPSIYLWNPSIRKTKRLPKGLIAGKNHDLAVVVLGFGLHPVVNDYRVVRIARFWHSIICAEVYSLRLNCWRIISSVPPVGRNVFWKEEGAYLNGVMYWIVEDHASNLRYIISFDMDSEVFQRIMFPDRLHTIKDYISIQVLDKSLAVFQHRVEVNHLFNEIWVLEMDTWKMIHRTLLPGDGKVAWPFGFTANGCFHIITSTTDGWYGQYQNLALYDPKSQKMKDLGIKVSFREGSRRRVYGYKESLMLLN